jgi:hypothetical protein
MFRNIVYSLCCAVVLLSGVAMVEDVNGMNVETSMSKESKMFSDLSQSFYLFENRFRHGKIDEALSAVQESLVLIDKDQNSKWLPLSFSAIFQICENPGKLLSYMSRFSEIESSSFQKVRLLVAVIKRVAARPELFPYVPSVPDTLFRIDSQSSLLCSNSDAEDIEWLSFLSSAMQATELVIK